MRIVIKACHGHCYMRVGLHLKKQIIQDNDGFWRLGIAGQTCDTTCNKYKCDATARSELNTDHSMKAAVDMAGSICTSTSNSPSDADGAPFVNGGGTKKCTMYKSSNKKMASCDTNSVSGGLPVCFCGTNPSDEEELISPCGKDNPCNKVDGGVHQTFTDNTKRTYSCVGGGENKNTLQSYSRSTIDSNFAWVACENYVGQWMQIDLGEEKDVAGVVFGSRFNNQVRVTEFAVYVGLESGMEEYVDTFRYQFFYQSHVVNVGNNPETQRFIFKRSRRARYVRFVVLRWHHGIQMRADVILSGITPKRALSLSDCRVVENPEGIARSYSSIYGNNWFMTGHSRSKLDSPQAWSPYDPGMGVWMMMDLQFVKVVTGVVMQGRRNSNQRVTKFRVEVSRDGLNFRDITPEDNDFAYTGSRDVKQNIVFEKAYMVRYVKIVPTEYNEWSSLRAGVLTCGDSYTLIDSGCDPESTFQGAKFDDTTRQEVCHAYQRRQLASESTSQGNGYTCVCQGDESGLTAVWNKKKSVDQCEAYDASSQHSKCESSLPMKDQYVQKRTYTIVSEGYVQSNKESRTGRARVSYKPSSSSVSEIHVSYYDHSTSTQTNGKYNTYYYAGSDRRFTPRGFALTVIDQTTLDVVSDDFFYYAIHHYIPDYFDLAQELNRLNSEEPGRIVMLTTVDEPFHQIYQSRYFHTLSRLQEETRRMGIQMSKINCDDGTCRNGNSECFRSSFAAVGVAGCEDNENCPSFVTSKWTGRTQDAIKLEVDIETDRCVGANHGDTCEVECKLGFTHSNSLATCEDGTWTNMPTCEATQCEGDPSDSDFTVIGECSNTNSGESCALECRDGFSTYEDGGMKGVSESDRKYSSVWANQQPGTGHARSAINSAQAWSIGRGGGSFSSGQEWAELDLGDDTYVRGVIVQGRRNYNQQVTEFDVLTCMNVNENGYCENAVYVAKSLQYTIGFTRNDEAQKQEFRFDTPVLARKVRFEVRKCHNHCSMRMDVLTAKPGDDKTTKFDCGIKGWNTCGVHVLRTVHSVNDIEGAVAKIRGADLEECGIDLCTNCDVEIETVLRRDNTAVSKLGEWIESGGLAVLKHVGGDAQNGDYTLTRKAHKSNSDWKTGDLIVVSAPSNAKSCVNINECIENPTLCGSGGTCVDMTPTSLDSRKHKCICDAQHHGVHCENEHDDCEGYSDSEMCEHGTCVNLDRTTHNETAFRCECDRNYELDDEGRCSIVKSCDGSNFEMTDGMIPFASTNENLPPCEHDGHCHKETGYCGYYETQGNVEVLVLPDHGILRLENADSADSCLQKCKAVTSTEVKGCEYVVVQ